MLVAAFLARFDVDYVRQLVAPVEGVVETDEERDARIEARVAAALSDAAGELEGWVVRLPEALRPSDATRDVHQLKVAIYLLTLDRPGKDFEMIRNAYNDTISFYKDAIADAKAAGGGGSSPVEAKANEPCSVFNRRTLKGFV